MSKNWAALTLSHFFSTLIGYFVCFSTLIGYFVCFSTLIGYCFWFFTFSPLWLVIVFDSRWNKRGFLCNILWSQLPKKHICLNRCFCKNLYWKNSNITSCFWWVRPSESESVVLLSHGLQNKHVVVGNTLLHSLLFTRRKCRDSKVHRFKCR